MGDIHSRPLERTGWSSWMRTILSSLAAALEHEAVIELTGVPTFEEASWPAGPEHVLVVWNDEYDGTYLFALPMGEIDYLDALLSLHLRGFGDASDFREVAEYGAMVRLMARLGMGGRRVEDFKDFWIDRYAEDYDHDEPIHPLVLNQAIPERDSTFAVAA